MQKFCDIPYTRPDGEAFIQLIRESAVQIKKAASFEEAKALFQKVDEEQKVFSTMETVASIRNTIDTRDAYYEGECQYFYQVIPQIEVALKEFKESILESEYIEKFETEFGSLYFTKLRNSVRLTSEKNVELQVQESMLVQEYSKASAVCTTEFDGQQMNFYGLLKQMQSTDRAHRKAAFQAWADMYESISGQLDDIYSSLIKLRLQMSENLGFESYTDMIYLARERFDYKKEQIKIFRDQIVEHVVPVCKELFESQRKRLGIETLFYYDESLVYPEGNVTPSGTTEEQVKKAQSMYHEMSKETGEFFDFMVKYDLFDLETKPGKHQGGYCTFLPTEKAPFIFSNFNGTSADVDVLTHEAGHAFEAYVASRENVMSGMEFSTSEIDEIHSMTMEYFAHPWMELFFGEEADKYRYSHLASSIQVLPYMACVDEFQERVYEEKLLSAEARYALWHELEQKYLPWRDYDGNAFLEKGGFWMQKQHIFMYPFYYIDYALAQMGALEYFVRMRDDRENAWKDYLRLCKAGGSKGYFELLKLGNLGNAFKEDTVKNVMEKVKGYLF